MTRMIDADELKIDYGFTWDDITPTHEEMYALIDRQPTIDAVKHGRWNGYNVEKGWTRDDGTPVFLVCSVCNGTVLNNGSAHWNFCPSCGARMDGEDNG